MSGDDLTFLEALALDPSEVEVEHHGEWVPLERPNHPSGEFLLSFLRKAKLRRRLRPKRSLVQEMAGVGDGQIHYGLDVGKRAEFGEKVVRTICDWLRVICSHGEDSAEEYAAVIYREFLEPR